MKMQHCLKQGFKEAEANCLKQNSRSYYTKGWYRQFMDKALHNATHEKLIKALSSF